MNESWHTYDWVMAHRWRSHGTQMNESWHTYECVMAHMNESWHTYEWAMAHIWMSHGTHMNESLHTYQTRLSDMSDMSDMSETCLRTNEPCLKYEWAKIILRHVSDMCVTWLIHMCAMSATIMNILRLIHVWAMSDMSDMLETLTCQTCLRHVSERAKTILRFIILRRKITRKIILLIWMGHSYLRHGSSVCVTWHI